MNTTRPSHAPVLLLPLLLTAACAEVPDRSFGADADAAVTVADATDAAITVADAPDAASAVADAQPADDAPVVPRPARPHLTGAVYLSQWNDGAGPGGLVSISSRRVWETGRSLLVAGCTTAVVEGCEVRRCAPDVEERESRETPLVDAGEIVVGGLDAGPFSFSDRDALAAHQFRRLWSGGEEIHVDGAGVPGVVPAFHLRAVAPGPLTVTSAPADGSRLARGAGFDVEWVPAGGLARVWINQTGPDRSTVRVRCDTPANLGHATVPAAALAVAPRRSTTHVYLVSLATAQAISDELTVTVDLKYIARELDLTIE